MHNRTWAALPLCLVIALLASLFAGCASENAGTGVSVGTSTGTSTGADTSTGTSTNVGTSTGTSTDTSSSTSTNDQSSTAQQTTGETSTTNSEETNSETNAPAKTSSSTTILEDGDYQIEADTDSSMFRIEQCTLHVQDGIYSATIALPGKGFSRLYFGTAEAAAQADENEIFDYYEGLDGAYTFDIPVSALNEELTVAAYGHRREKWYDHTILFHAPTENTHANTAASSQYTTLVESFHNPDMGNGWKPTSSIDLDYATCFTIDQFEGGYQLACLHDGARYLFIPEGANAPEGIASDIVVLQKPVHNIYLVASDTACLFDALETIDTISVSGIKPNDWHVAAMRDAMENGQVAYGGKYSTPDYELLLAQEVSLAIESTMINHTPDVRDKLTELGIPVLVEMSSYENEPLGRAEWVKLYGALLDKEDLAERLFQEQVRQAEGISSTDSGKTVAFFYINSNGAAVVRRPGDYVTSMIAQAGGTYVFDTLDPAAVGSGSVTLEMERFYATAKDADIIVYNSSIDNSIDSLDALLAKNELLSNFKAVQTGNVWATDQNMYQQMMQSGGIIADFNRMLNGSTGNLTYLRQLT